MSTLQDTDATETLDGPLSGHPNANISSGNMADSPLLQLPLEIRLNIYELAVKEDDAIRPRQVTKGSNLFVWGPARYARYHPGQKEWSWVQTGGKRLTVTTLLATCRAIYADLSARPVFYRVNTFAFSCSSQLHTFLAALTPARRNAVREITYSDHRDVAMSILYTSPQVFHKFDDMLPILTHCQGLRSLKVVLTYRATFLNHARPSALAGMSNDLTKRLRDHAKAAAEDDGHDASLWSLPALSLEYHFVDTGSLEPLLSGIAVSIQQALTRRQRAPNRTDLRRIFAPADMQKAIQKAKVELVGEVRLTRDRGEAADAPIARRTRDQKKARQIVNQYGTLKSPIAPKYDLNGHLQWNFESIKEVRWSTHSIECQVAYFHNSCDPKGDIWPPSYEPIHVLGTDFGLERLRVYYQSFCAYPEFQIGPIEKRIQQMQSMPSPKDCAQEHTEMMTIKSRYSTWKAMQNNWVKTIDRLQAYARHLQQQSMPKPGENGDEGQPAGQGIKHEADTTIYCAARPTKKLKT